MGAGRGTITPNVTRRGKKVSRIILMSLYHGRNGVTGVSDFTIKVTIAFLIVGVEVFLIVLVVRRREDVQERGGALRTGLNLVEVVFLRSQLEWKLVRTYFCSTFFLLKFLF
jgi:hypothetical protein